jgi:hypothetical protein
MTAASDGSHQHLSGRIAAIEPSLQHHQFSPARSGKTLKNQHLSGRMAAITAFLQHHQFSPAGPGKTLVIRIFVAG